VFCLKVIGLDIAKQLQCFNMDYVSRLPVQVGPVKTMIVMMRVQTKYPQSILH